MPLPRFLVPSLDDGDRREVSLPAGEARHLTRVLRLGAGARVAVFDGRGHEFVATVIAVTRDRVTVRLEEPLAQRPEPRVPIVLAQSILKGDKMDDVIRDATMLGVSGIVPLVSDHVSVKPSAIERGRPEERWERIAVASAKQCRRSTIPTVHHAVSFADWLARSHEGRRLDQAERRVPSPDSRVPSPESRVPSPGVSDRGPEGRDLTLLLIEPNLSMAQARSIRSLLSEPPPTQATIAVGPEGGWSAREVEAAMAAGCVPVTLGALTLRADAVALVALSALLVVWGE